MRDVRISRTFTFIVCTVVTQSSLLFASLACAETKVFYYEKSADSGRVVQALDDFERAGERSLLRITVPPNPYYEEQELTTNAVMCGSQASLSEVREIVEALRSHQVEILYVGQYRRPELNSRRNTIDIRAIGDKIFYETHLPIEPEDINWSQLQCGFGEEGVYGERRR